MMFRGHGDNTIDLCGEDNVDAKRQCLGKGQTMLTKPPSQAEFEECWSEVIIKNGLSPSLVDDPLFRKVLVTTAGMGQSTVCMCKGTALGKRDTTLPHHHTFSRKIIPASDKRLDEDGMFRLRRVDPSALAFSLSSHRYLYIGLLFSSRFIYCLIINKPLTCPNHVAHGLLGVYFPVYLKHLFSTSSLRSTTSKATALRITLNIDGAL
jgi:hypothetical protein